MVRQHKMIKADIKNCGCMSQQWRHSLSKYGFGIYVCALLVVSSFFNAPTTGSPQ